MNEKDELIELGKKLKGYRESNRLTQSKLAHLINKDREAISRLERGLVNPSYLFLKTVCKGLGITLCDILIERECEDD